MLRSIEGVNITRNNSCYSFLKEEIFQFYKAIGYGYSSEKDVLSWICFLTWHIDKNAHDPGEVDENRSFLVVSLHDRFSGWSFLGSMRTVSETAHTKKNLSLIVCLSLKWSVKWFRIADFTTIVRKLDRFINHTVSSVAIYEVWFRSLTIMTQLLLSGFFPRHWYISVASPWVTWWEVEMAVERWVERGEQGKYWALL